MLFTILILNRLSDGMCIYLYVLLTLKCIKLLSNLHNIYIHNIRNNLEKHVTFKLIITFSYIVLTIHEH